MKQPLVTVPIKGRVSEYIVYYISGDPSVRLTTDATAAGLDRI